ncbi:pyrroline-5-carboxylate reductase [Sutcliffiella cohnii]|uniref:Pyrroline-5-carboxylate reductase n=1 Tax=Sutcliffiella cohnii TaxID=33932 RepID=A0A223KU95_9BACI|nr:pyrroline-5-carboxylate reductase [Sutcliffiella cohnii]AST93071.1 pyrroline-5-carboxylate reductase [Sutcliffiella cohnii]
MLKNKTIGFIGAGSMAEAMISGIVSSDLVPSHQIIASNRSNVKRLSELETCYGIKGLTKDQLAINELDIIVLAMKPKDIDVALESLQQQLQPHQLVLSVIAGISTTYIEEKLRSNQPVIRVMPNTSSMIGESATALSLGTYVTEEQTKISQKLLCTIGKVYIIAEEHMDVFTGVAGSGPAYFYYLMEHMERTAKEAGLDHAVCRDAVAQTILGAAKMMLQNDEEPASLRKRVTSPNGTTAAGIEALRSYGGGKAISEAIKGAAKRSEEISMQMLDENNNLVIN